jgi:hypothetical protein
MNREKSLRKKLNPNTHFHKRLWEYLRSMHLCYSSPARVEEGMANRTTIYDEWREGSGILNGVERTYMVAWTGGNSMITSCLGYPPEMIDDKENILERTMMPYWDIQCLACIFTGQWPLFYPYTICSNETYVGHQSPRSMSQESYQTLTTRGQIIKT